MRLRELKPSTRVGYRNRPRTLPARKIIQEFLEKDEPDFDYDDGCCPDCIYGPATTFELGAFVAFRLPGFEVDAIKPGPGWFTGQIVAVNKGYQGRIISYDVQSDQPIKAQRLDPTTCPVINVGIHHLKEISILERLAWIF
jgi:hypothetical protein